MLIILSHNYAGPKSQEVASFHDTISEVVVISFLVKCASGWH